MNPRPKEDVVRIYRRLFRYVMPYWGVIGAAVVATVVLVGANTRIPLIMRDVIDGLQGPERGTAADIPLLIVAVFAVRGLMEFFSVYGLTWVGRSVVRNLRGEVFAQYLNLPAAFYDRNASGMLLSRLTYNTEQVADAVSNAAVTAIRDSLTIVGLLWTMIYLSPELTLVIAVVAPTIGLLVAYMSRAFRRYSRRIQNSMGNVTRVTEQALAGHKIVKLFEGQAYEQRQFEQENTMNFRLNLRLVATRAAGDALTQYAIALGVATVIFVAFSDRLLADLSAALFVGFITAMGMLLTPMKRLVNINAILQRGIAAASSLFEILDEPAEIETGEARLKRASGAIEYRHVGFAYGKEGRSALKDVSFSVRPGSTLAVVGHSGSGKSTLVGLLPRFYEMSSGEILLDGGDIRGYRLKDLRRQLSFVSQDVVLFDDTIAGNIAYGALADCSKAEIERAAEAAFVTEFAAAMPAGLDTPVGERGMLLSGGQRQRVAIARALLKDAPVLILDEATSALDSESERRIQEALSRLMRGRTTLVVAHRLSTVEHADSIIVMQDGQIVECGRHSELLQLDGAYAHLYRMQFAD